MQHWIETDFAANAPDFRVKIKDNTFLPFYGAKVGVGLSLDILLLSGSSPYAAVLSSGDLDNRLKRIVDALRAPTQPSELDPCGIDHTEFYCLMDDDSAVKAVNVQLAPFLDSGNRKESFVLVRAKPFPLKITMGNLEMVI